MPLSYLLISTLLASRGVSTHADDDANMSFFDDDVAATGVRFDAYPLAWNGTGNVVYPIAVHHDDFERLAYKVLRITVRATGREFYGHVVDLCDRGDSSCRVNARKHGFGFLIDVHKKGWKAVGASDGVLKCKYKIAGNFGIGDIPSKAQDDVVLCECDDTRCDLDEAIWCPRGKCGRAPNCY